MPRPKGVPNKKPTIAELELQLAELRKASGESNDKADTTNDKLNIVTSTDPEVEENDYECGACGHKLEAEYSVCPYCGTRLIWS